MRIGQDKKNHDSEFYVVYPSGEKLFKMLVLITSTLKDEHWENLSRK